MLVGLSSNRCSRLIEKWKPVCVFVNSSVFGSTRPSVFPTRVRFSSVHLMWTGLYSCYWTFSPVSCTLGTRSNVVYSDALLCGRYEIIQHAQRLWSRIFRSHVFHSRLYQPMSPCAIKLHLIRLLQNALYCVLCGCSPVGHESQESLKIFLKYTKMRKQGSRGSPHGHRW